MTGLKDIRQVFFLGIGGIGMSALARYFRAGGARVSGYDRTPSPLTEQLEQEGIRVRFEDRVDASDQKPDLVVYTPAIPAGNIQLAFYRDAGVPVLKRSEVLGRITSEMDTIAVGGTHGKTTVSALIAHILRESGYGCHAFLGGISLNYETNFWSADRPLAVAEADEYDRSFLQLSPRIAVVTAMDPDHLDIYGTVEQMRDAYIQFTHRIKPGGLLLYKKGLDRVAEMGGDEKLSYSLEDDTADCFARDIRMEAGGYSFSVVHEGTRLDHLNIRVGGRHNVENAVAAVTIAHRLGIDPGRIRETLASFRGIKRRFEYLIKTPDRVYIDDYAHHPEELRTLIRSARALFPDKGCMVVFQPHLFTRTRDLAAEFGAVLDTAEEVILLPVYAARETPLEGVDSGLIQKQMKNPAVFVLSRVEALEKIKERAPRLLISAGAGDIDRMTNDIRELFLPGAPTEGTGQKEIC